MHRVNSRGSERQGGVIVKFEGQVMAKVKSQWWFRANKTEAERQWNGGARRDGDCKGGKVDARQRQHSGCRLGVGTTQSEIVKCVAGAGYKWNGRLRVVMASYSEADKARAMVEEFLESSLSSCFRK